MEDQKDKSGGAAATATLEDNTFEALEKDFQDVGYYGWLCTTVSG